MQGRSRRTPISPRLGNSSANVTSAIGIEETAGHLRARRHSLFTQTVMWITGLVCIACLLGSIVQAWSNSKLDQQLQIERQKTEQIQAQHDHLTKVARHYSDPSVIESEARQQLGYVRPGEHPVIVMAPNSENQPNGSAKDSKAPQSSFWQEWWNVFFDS